MQEEQKSETNVAMACFLVVAIPLGIMLAIAEFIAIYQPVRAGTGSSKLAVFVALMATMFSGVIVVFAVAWVGGTVLDLVDRIRQKPRS